MPCSVSRRSIFASNRSSLSLDCDEPQKVEQCQAWRLPDELQKLRLPVFERGGEELREEIRPGKGLPVLLGLVPLSDHLEDELSGPGEPGMADSRASCSFSA